MKISKLSLKLLLYISPLVILPLLFLGGLTQTSVSNSTEKQVKLTVSRFVAQQQQKVLNYISTYQSTTKLLSSSPVLFDFLSQRDKANNTQKLSALLDVFASYEEAYPDILNINLVDHLGGSLAFYASNLNQPPSFYPFFEQVLSSNLHQLYFMESAFNSTTHLYFIQEVYSPELPTPSHYIIIKVDPSIINYSILQSPYEQTLNLLVTGSGQVLFSSDPQLKTKNLTEQETHTIEQAADQEELATFDLPTLYSQQRIGYSVQLSDDYFYLSAYPKELLNEAGRTIKNLTFLIVFLSIFALPLFILIVVKRFLITPIELLGEASHRVGDGDLSVYLPTQNKDEIGKLFIDFNEMVTQIRDARDLLEDYKHNLEKKVSNRTHALERTNKELEAAYTQAEQANELKSRFLANMSHEIRTPLTAIIGFTEQLLEQGSSELSQRHLETMLRNSRHLLELINNILDLSKIEAEKLAVEQHEVDVQSLIEDIAQIIQPMSEKKGLSFTLDYLFPLPVMLYSDTTRLKQILIDICSNAVKFTEQGGITIRVAYLASNQQFKFQIEDTGIGMSREAINRIFKPFEQADTTTTRRFGGTGLGLCIAKNLAILLGGDVTVQSEQGMGSSFTVTIAGNYHDMQPTMMSELSASVPEKSISQGFAEMQFDARILLAEDNPDNQELICLLLQAWGITPDVVSDGAQAVEKALVNDYQLILMDMQMPVMGGLEAIEMLRHAAYDGPIIALTANVMKHDLEVYLKAGCDATLGKPIDRVQLGKVLLKHLQLQAASDSKWDSLLKSEKFEQITQNYTQKLPDYMQELEAFYQTNDWESLRALAHSLKGSAGCFGLMNIHSAADFLEQTLTSNDSNRRQYAILSLIEAIKYTIQRQSATSPA